MSTKIYDAYRVKKQVDLRELLFRMKHIAEESMAANADILYYVHAMSVALADKDLHKGNHLAVDVLSENSENNFAFSSLHWIEKCIKDAHDGYTPSLMDVTLTMSIWFDEDYWYMKFFVNSGAPVKMMNAIEKACPELEDYHYQNQTDPPDNISYDEFETREKKWDELTLPHGNYRGMMQFVVFDHIDFSHMVRRYWWTGEKDLYKHMAYKFDKKFETKGANEIKK